MAGKVYINDAATKDGGEVEQTYPGAANWADTQIDMQDPPNTTGLSGQLYLIVETDDGAIASRAITVSSSGETVSGIDLVSLQGSPKSSLTGLKWAWFDQPDPANFNAPTDKGSAEVTDSGGTLDLTLSNTTLTTGQTGLLVLKDDTNGLIGAYRLTID